MCPPYSHPYIMDLTAMRQKLDGKHELYPQGSPLPRPKLIEIIEEFTRLEAHCDNARGLCAHNLGQIIQGNDPVDYPDITVPTS